jgi:hypothetical protein
MINHHCPMPFGLLFEEPAPLRHNFPIPQYDEETDLSYIKDQDGRQVPFIEFRFPLQTQTFTALAAEETDEDDGAHSLLIGTATTTKTFGETTDEDQSGLPSWGFGTQTITETVETTDTDEEITSDLGI